MKSLDPNPLDTCHLTWRPRIPTTSANSYRNSAWFASVPTILSDCFCFTCALSGAVVADRKCCLIISILGTRNSWGTETTELVHDDATALLHPRGGFRPRTDWPRNSWMGWGSSSVFLFAHNLFTFFSGDLMREVLRQSMDLNDQESGFQNKTLSWCFLPGLCSRALPTITGTLTLFISFPIGSKAMHHSSWSTRKGEQWLVDVWRCSFHDLFRTIFLQYLMYL